MPDAWHQILFKFYLFHLFSRVAKSDKAFVRIPSSYNCQNLFSLDRHLYEEISATIYHLTNWGDTILVSVFDLVVLLLVGGEQNPLQVCAGHRSFTITSWSWTMSSSQVANNQLGIERRKWSRAGTAGGIRSFAEFFANVYVLNFDALYYDRLYIFYLD